MTSGVVPRARRPESSPYGSSGRAICPRWRSLAASALVLLAVFAWPVAADDDEVEIEATVEAMMGPNAFVVDSGVIIDVEPATKWENDLSGLGDLTPAIRVKVKGAWQERGVELRASKVARTSDGLGSGDDEDGDHGGGDGDDSPPAGIMFETRGRISEVLPPDGFALADGTHFTVDAATRYDPVIGSFDGLSAGQYLEVKAVRMGDGVNLAAELGYEGDSDGGQGYGEIYGVAAAVTDTQLLLEDGTVIVHDALTEWRGDADRWQDVQPGFAVDAQVFHDQVGRVVAREVRTDDQRLPATEGEDYEPRQALVVLASGADAAAVADRSGAEVAATIGDFAALLRWQDELDDARLAALAADSGVRAVEPNYRFRDPESVRRRYPIIDGRASMASVQTQTAAGAVGLQAALARSTGLGAVVAVIDTGVDPSHPALLGRIVPGGRDLVDGDDQPWETRNGIDDDGDGEIDEAAGHGTFVASVIAAVAPAAGILPLRVLDDDGGGTAFAVAEALAFAIDARVDVINLSLTYHRRSAAVDLLLERAAAAGIVVVAAAGNDGASTVDFPASDSNVVGVTATVADETVLTAFANRSPLVQVAAPGEDVLGALDRGLFATWSGTSMAAPFVAGTAALLKSIDPTLDPALVRDALLQGSRPLVDGTWSGVALDAGGAVGLLASTSPNLRTAPAGRLAPSGAAAGTP